MDEEDIKIGLLHERFITLSDYPESRKFEAWKRIDVLLDAMNEIKLTADLIELELL